MRNNTTASRPNFFLLLELNPDAAWDQAAFDAALRKKRIEWSNQRAGVGKRALDAKKFLLLIDEIRRVMETTQLREQEAEAARAERSLNQRSHRQQRLQECEERIAYLNAKTAIEQVEFDTFVAAFQDVLSPQEIRERLHVSIIPAHVETMVDTPVPLDASLMTTILDLLKSIEVMTLYELLGYPETTATDQLSRAAEQLIDDMTHRQQKTAEVDAKLQLAGLAKDVFRSEEMRKRYDYSMRLFLLEPLLKELDAIVALAPDKELHGGQVRLFLERARKVGWDERAALIQLKEHARKENWNILLFAAPGPHTEQLRCGSCHTLNDKYQKFCRTCQKSLYIDCPNCDTTVASDDIHCGSCGFPVGNRLWIEDDLARCHTLLQDRDLKEAQRLLTKMEGAWQSKKRDALQERIEQCKAKLQQIRQEQEQKADHLKQLMAHQLFFEARQFLLKNTNDIPEHEKYDQTINLTIAHAQEELRLAQRSGISVDEKREHCIQALRQCADLKEALAVLKTLPPTAAKGLQVQRHDTIVTLSWTPSSTRNVMYAVIRKARSQPTSLQDGDELARISGVLYEDTQPVIGVPLYYGVFAVCEGVPSTQAALLTKPVMFVQDVLQEAVVVGDHRVELSWQLPSYAHSVVVVRKEQTQPISALDGVQLSPANTTQTSVIDRTVQNGQVYYYGIYCRFKDFEGQLVAAPGKIVMAKPEIPPAPITTLSIYGTTRPQGYEVVLRWLAPLKGTVVVLKSERPSRLKVGEVIPEAQLHSQGQILEGHAGEVREIWTNYGVAYYLPVVLLQGMAYIGLERYFAAIEDISNLRRQIFGNSIRVMWKWPQNCQEAVIHVKKVEPFSASSTTVSDNTGSSQNVNSFAPVYLSRAEYNRVGGYHEVPGMLNHTYIITVAALVRQEGGIVQGQGQTITVLLVPQLEISYYIKNPIFSKKRTLCIHPITSGFLPPFCLVCKPDFLPSNKGDGEIVGRWGELQLTAGREVELELPVKPYAPNTTILAKLFLEDAAHHEIVKVNLPREERLRIK